MEKTVSYCLCDNCEFRDLAMKYLDDESINKLCENKKENLYRKGEIIYHQDDKITDFKYLKRGLVKLYRRKGLNDEQIITITRNFDFINSISVFEEEKYRFSVAALEDSEICSINIEIMKKLLTENGNFATGILVRMSNIYEKIIAQFLEIRKRNLAGRVAFVLLYFAREIFNSNIFDLPVLRKEIADYIGMSTANVIRTLSEFKYDGIIKVYGKTIEIVDLNKLKVFSDKG